MFENEEMFDLDSYIDEADMKDDNEQATVLDTPVTIDNSVKLYMREMGAIPMLSFEEENHYAYHYNSRQQIQYN